MGSEFIEENLVREENLVPCPNCGHMVVDTSGLARKLRCPNCGQCFIPTKKENLEEFIDDEGEFIEL